MRGRNNRMAIAQNERHHSTFLIAMATTSLQWLPWALGSAAFAALTAIFAKIGIQGIDSDVATWVRTLIIAVVLGAFLLATQKWTNPLAFPPRAWLFLALSGLATGASWVC